jgi:type III secretion protein N (ATPase)
MNDPHRLSAIDLSPRLDAGAAASDPLLAALGRVRPIERVGKVAEAYGTLIRATGLRAAIGELCELRNPPDVGDPAFRLFAEVVGVSRQHAVLTPLGALDGVSPLTEVYATGRQASVRAGDALLGRVLDAHGEPMDNKGPLAVPGGAPLVEMPIYAASPNPLDRNLIDRAFPTGVRAIDT